MLSFRALRAINHPTFSAVRLLLEQPRRTRANERTPYNENIILRMVHYIRAHVHTTSNEERKKEKKRRRNIEAGRGIDTREAIKLNRDYLFIDIFRFDLFYPRLIKQ